MLFGHLESSKEVPQLLSERRFGDIVRLALDACYGKAVLVGDRRESAGTLATGLLHYALTRALVPSQRKVEFRGVDVDIVVPDLRTLESSPQDALVVCIQYGNGAEMRRRLAETGQIQPVRENIWAVLSDDVPTGHRQFLIRDSLADMISEIQKFAGPARFGILGE